MPRELFSAFSRLISNLASPDDQALVKRAKTGDVSAFQALISPHIAVVRRFAYAFCRNWPDADDLAQEALIKAFRSMPKFRGDAAVSTWLITIVRSVCIDWRRSHQAKTRALENELGEEHVDPQDGQDALLDGKGEAERLWSGIRHLDPRFRVPLVLHDIEGMPYEQIASIERVPIGTVRSRLARGRQQLREILTESAGGQADGPSPGTQTGEASSNQGGRPAS